MNATVKISSHEVLELIKKDLRDKGVKFDETSMKVSYQQKYDEVEDFSVEFKVEIGTTPVAKPKKRTHYPSSFGSIDR